MPQPLSISPEIAFEPAGQFLRNLTAEHKSQIHQALAHGIKCHTLRETGKSPHETEPEETRLLWFHKNLLRQCLLSWVLWGSLPWMAQVFPSRHPTVHGQCREPELRPQWVESWVPKPMMVPPHCPRAPSHDSEEGHFSFPPRPLTATGTGWFWVFRNTNAPILAAALPNGTFLLLLFPAPSGD